MKDSRRALLARLWILLLVSAAAESTNCTEIYDHNSPQISPCTKEIILQKGQNYTLTCRADTPVEIMQLEIPEEQFGNFTTISRNSTEQDEYVAYLDLINIDRFAIGYYACIRVDDSVDDQYFGEFKEITEELENTESVSFIYVFVNGTDSLFAPMREIVKSKKELYVVECRPSTPDVEVKITLAGKNKTPNYLMYSPKIGFLMDDCNKIAFRCKATKNGSDPETFAIRRQNDLPKPKVTGLYKEYILGETFSLNCSVIYSPNSAQVLTWDLPPEINNTVIHDSNQFLLVTEGIQYHNITIVNATANHARVYTCIAKNQCGESKSSFEKILLENAVLSLDYTFTKRKIIVSNLLISKDIDVHAYPPANFSLYKNNVLLPNRGKEFLTERKIGRKRQLIFKMKLNSLEDSGNYTIVATNGYKNANVTLDLRYPDEPKILSYGNTIKYCEQHTMVTLPCEVTGYPLPNIKWTSSIDHSKEMDSTKIEIMSLYREKAFLNVRCDREVNITCKASQGAAKQESSIFLRVDEVPSGFGIVNEDEDVLWFSAEEDSTVKCVASKYKFNDIYWKINGTKVSNDSNVFVEYKPSNYSRVANLKLTDISEDMAGFYVCVAQRIDGTNVTDQIEIRVDALSAPDVRFNSDVNGTVEKFQPILMTCEAEGVPRPVITWYRGDKEFIPLNNDTNIEFHNSTVDRKTVKSTIFIKQMSAEIQGTFECVATNIKGQERKVRADLILKEVLYTKYIIVIVIIFVMLIAIVVFLAIKVKKDKVKKAKLRQELAAAGLLYFNDEKARPLNPDLFIDEQADALPYDKKFEFPPEKLVLGQQLGAGAFGVVFKAEARGILNAEETTPVAVKMVKRTADPMYIKALATELRIMVHLGKHVNIVNLLGACTQNVNKREFLVIVEYCKFGNIHNYMQRHREVFIDLFSDDSKEKMFGKVNPGYDSSGSTALQSDNYSGNTQNTDHTFLTNNTQRTSRKNLPSQPQEPPKASEGYVQPEWRSNYMSDYSYDGRSPRPLTSRDLLCWAFQIARGMEYLASRKILHGDLAARNILLAEDNVVKICDFGLARSIYKHDEYQKKENSLLPVKWLAIECMTDRIFSTQSDVWAFGIVLWEMFTLAKTPYPNMDPHHLLPFLREGRRLDKPVYADDRIYSVMKRCWQEKPTMRPSFTQLQEELGTFLEENVRMHYVDLNNAYMELNNLQPGHEDYLAMVSAPDYNNMVTPSPHHYVNEVGEPKRFFPHSPTKVDDDGYLQMTPRSTDVFSPKPLGMPRFDFDPRKLNTRSSEASSAGSELTPMLTINNLARSGSDSDHEGAVYPYPNGCPTINEESVDDVFINNQNKETSFQNTKNAQNTAVTNPTYISFEEVEKKPKDVVNSYMNVNSNGLVKF